MSPTLKRLRWQGAAWAIGLGVWFFLIYGLCNYITSIRSDVGVFYWEWEKKIPFIPAFIVPYMSLDIFFVLAFLMASSQAELNILVRRMFTVITLSAICFLIWPLKFDFPRPVPSGWSAGWFTALYAGDLPFNLAPSLHISQRCLLWITFGRHLKGIGRTCVRNWFILIGASTLVTWQHHFMDVVTGFLMAYLVVAFWPEKETMPVWKWKSAESRKLAFRYGIGAAACALLAFPAGGWLWFGWPATALAIISTAYATGNTRWLQKSSGAPVPAVEWILFPVVLVTRVWQRRWLRRLPAWQEMSPGVFFGRLLSHPEAADFLASHPGLTVIDLTAETKEAPAFRERANYISMPVLDLTPPSPELVKEAVSAIKIHSAEGPVYVHCLLGIGRTSHIANAWLMQLGRESNLTEVRARLYQPVLA